MSDLGWKYLTSDDKAAILKGIADGRAYGGPYHVEIHPADRCNIECFFCSTASIRGTDEMPMTRFEELLGELKEAGTRSIRLAGGGEPLFHRKTKDFLGAIDRAGFPIENVTTNAVLLDEAVAEILVRRCDQVTVSLNTGDAQTYASMMQTPERNFERVLKNVRKLVEIKKREKSRRPIVNLQFLVWKENYKSIPKMYVLARELGVDTIQFNGLAFLKPEQMMTAAETDEMMRLYERVVREDEYRKISVINSYEQDLSERVKQMNDKLTADRLQKPRWRRLAALALRKDFTFGEKLEHHSRMKNIRKLDAALAGLDEYCVIGWHSLVIRTSGIAAPCCILQGKELGNIFKQPLKEVWYGEGFNQLRRELSEIMKRGEEWQHDASRHDTVVPMCGQKGAELCPIRSFYYRPDVPFVKALNDEIRSS